MVTTVIMNDFETNRRTVSVLDQDDYETIAGVWGDEDRLLVELANEPFFEGKTRWCDLDPSHFRLLILRNLTMVAELSDEERTDSNHATLRSLHFLIGALVVCLQERSESQIELVRVNRMNRMEASFDYAASLNMHIDPPKPKPGVFKIVVDNE